MVVRHEHVGLGLAVDLEKRDGSRTLLVPCIRDADTLDFKRFWGAYEDLIRKVRNNKIVPDDFAGATISLTNPGTIGTVQSVPRLMPGQGADRRCRQRSTTRPRTRARTGRCWPSSASRKCMTLTSTYDHRIIQGAESGLFLKRVHELLLGADGFYDDVFRSLGVPYEPVQWRRDVNPIDREQVLRREADARPDAHQHVSRARPSHRRPRSARAGKNRTCIPSSIPLRTA